MDSNLLMDPIEELTQVLSINSFGLAPSPATQIILDNSFPINDEDKLMVAEETVRSGKINDKVQAKAKVGLLEGDILEVVLDKRGYTLVSATTTTSKQYPSTTYESLEAMLIGVSPAYVAAMTQEITRRFEMDPGAEASLGDEDEPTGPTEAEVKEAEAGSEVWKSK